jgi:REP element-mobilizing transposase RayT
VTNCRRYSVSELVNHFKGYSSWYVRRALPEDVSMYLWGDSFWSDGYFYESIGRVTSKTVKFYIERQQGKHWMHKEPDALVNSPNQVSLHAFGI